MRIVSLCISLLLVALAAESHSEPRKPPNFEAMMGQLIVVGFEGASANSPGFKEILADLEAGRIGGVLFLERNIGSRSQVKAMTAQLKACRCAFPPLIMIDEEGGRVERLTGALGFVDSESAKSVGLNPDRAKRAFDMLATDVRDAGFNMNLGPVVDLDRNPANPVIGKLSRSYSVDPGRVVWLAQLFIERHHRFGVLTALKHFPGHGSSRTDSHLGYADVTKSWEESELLPYQSLTIMADAVMVGHIANNDWNGLASLAPATAISKLLRDEMNYDGVVMTDDLDMGAVRLNSPDFEKTIVRAIDAGSDLLIVSNLWSKRPHVSSEINRAMVAAVADNRIAKRSIAASFSRVMRLKAKLAKIRSRR